MSRITGLLFFRILRMTFYSTFALTFCAWVVQSSRYMYMIGKYHISLKNFIKFTSILSVDIIATVLPITYAVSCAVVYKRFKETNQLVALQASGISPKILLHPLLMCGAIMASYVYLTFAYVSPMSWRVFRGIEYSLKHNISLPESAGILFSNAGFDVYAQEYCGSMTFKNIIVIDARDASKIRSFVADNGYIRSNVLTLHNGEQIETDFSKNATSVAAFKKYVHDLNHIISFQRSGAAPNEKFMSELGADSDISASKRTEEIALFHQKILSSFLPLIFSIISFLFVVFARYRRKESFLGVCISSGIIIVLHGVFFLLSNASAKNAALLPANYLFVMCALLMSVIVLIYKKRSS